MWIEWKKDLVSSNKLSSDSYLDNIAKVTPAQVQAVAQKYLIDDHLTIAVLEPQPLTDNTPVTTQPTTGAIR